MRRLMVLFLSLLWVLSGALLTQAQNEIEFTGPYLQNITATSVTVMWLTDIPTESYLAYYALTTQADTRLDMEPQTIHAITLDDLEPDTVYHYRVSRSGAEDFTEWFEFRTLPAADQPVRVAIYGDSRSHAGEHQQVAAALAAYQPAIVLHTGDLVEDGRDLARWQTEFFDPSAVLLRQVAVFPVLGNHEYNADLFFDLFTLPGNEQWYALTVGSARLIALNTTISFGAGSEQYAWLVDELNSAEFAAAEWQIVYFHHPVYTSSAAHIDDEFWYEYIRWELVPLFERAGVDLVFGAHEHQYERSYANGITYIVTAGGGAELYGFDPDRNPYSQVWVMAHHFCLLDITAESLTLTVYDVNGAELDTLRLNTPN